MNFHELLTRAKDGENSCMEELASMYRPLLLKEAIINGVFDEDLHQELWLTFINCVRKIKF